ncbi:MAG: type II toxin-antitoxin system HicB family antitoxin [bacterium]
MNRKEITYWQDTNFWLGYINEYPEYVTQGSNIDELIENLKDIYHDILNEKIPGLRKSMTLELT